MNYLQSGVSPQDVQYRHIQQALSNLGAFQNGQTPEAQFGQLSAAGNGAAPFATPNYSTPAGLNPGAAAQTGINFANTNYQTSQQLANPFLSGLTTGVNTFSALNNLGGALGNMTSAITPAYLDSLVNSNPNYLGQTSTAGATPIGDANIGGVNFGTGPSAN